MITQHWHWCDPASAEIDRPNAGRIYDCVFGGSSNFAVDRQVARRLVSLDPRLPKYVWANRYFPRWAVEMVTAAGVAQFVDIGAGVSVVDGVRAVAQRLNPKARTVLVDVDPVAVLHWEKLLLDDPLSTVIHGDVRDQRAVIAGPRVRELIDTRQPVAVVATAVFHFVPDADLLRLVEEIGATFAPGSYLAVSPTIAPATADDAWTAAVLAAYAETPTPLTLRGRAQVARLFTGWAPGRPVTGLGDWLEPRLAVAGVAGLGRLS